MRDYWGKRAGKKMNVFLSSCIEDGIVTGNENNERTRKLKQQRECVSIGGYHCSYTEKLRIKTILQNLFAGTEYEPMIDDIQNLIENKEKSAKVIYLGSLHTFGRKNGLAIYNKIKTCGEL